MRVFGVILCSFLVLLNRISLSVVAKFGIVILMVVLLGILCVYIGIFTAHERDLYASPG